MEEEQRSKKCFQCNNFDAYYTKESRDFRRAKHGFCIKRRCVVQNSETCERWNTKVRYSYAERTVQRALNEILAQISAIRQIFEEEREEENL